MAGLPVSPVNASPHTSRCVTHDSGPEWFATSSPYWTCTNYLLPALLAHRTCTSKIAPMLGAQEKGQPKLPCSKQQTGLDQDLAGAAIAIARVSEAGPAATGATIAAGVTAA